MRNAHPKYLCYPSVVCVGVETEATIFPKDISRVFSEEKEYELLVIGLRDDMVNYIEPLPYTVACRVEKGCLKFKYTFRSEQEYDIRFREKDGNTVKISMYAVREDLYALRPLKGELHSHSYYSDGDDGLPMVPADYREEGFDFFALTDHNRMYTSNLLPKLYEGIPLGMTMLPGEEIHTPGSSLHIVHIGGAYSVCEKYVKHADVFEAEVAEIEKGLGNVCKQYRHRLALATWACKEIKKAGGISIFAHPFWKSNIYNVSEEFCNLLFDAKIFDVFELFNGADVHLDNLQISLWQEQMLKGNVMPVVGSSDSHNHDFTQDGFARCFSIVFAKSNRAEDILEAIRNGWSVAAEIPHSADAEARFYAAQFRLVSFTRFLWEHYFNETWRICIGEGILMRRFAEGEETGDVLGALAGSVEDFYKRFYGITPVDGLQMRSLQYLETVRKAQMESGVETKGSHLYIYGNGRNARRV